jgi:hypothetical protein
MSILYPPSTKVERRTLMILLGVSGLSLLSVAILYALDPRKIIGDTLVNTPTGDPIEIPPPSISPYFHFKPVTLFFAASIVFSYSFFSLFKTRITNLPGHVRSLLLTLAVLGSAVSVYEVLFNFTLWSVLMITQTSNPDHAVNGFPGGILQINLVFATKTFVALLFLSVFAIESLRKPTLGSSSQNG